MFTRQTLKSVVTVFFVIAVMLGIYSVTAPEISHAGSNKGSAATVSLNRYYKCHLMNRGYGEDNDVQWYQFKTPDVKGVSYKINMVGVSGRCGDVELELYDNNGNFVNSKEGEACGYSAHVKIGDPAEYSLSPNKWYYIKVSYVILDTYDLTVKFKTTCRILPPARSNIFSAKAKGRKITVSYKKMNFATQYQYRFRKTDGNWSKVKSCGNKCSKSFKVKKGGRKYVVQVRARRKYNGKWYTGKWSAGKTVRVK